MDGPTIALYARVSTRDKQDPLSQLLPLRDFAQQRQYMIVEEYVDVGVSGSKSKRPQLDRLMKDARARKFQIVGVWKFDRFGRSTIHLLDALEEFKQLEIAFVSLQESIDTTTTTGKFFFTMLSAFAEFERSVIIDRVKAGVDRARRQGKKLGRPKVQVDLEQACRLAAEGLGSRTIAKRMGLSHGVVQRALKAYQKPVSA